jgi:hypothetical protein
MRNAPLIGHGMAENLPLICPTSQHDGLRQINTTGKSVAARKILSSAEQLLHAFGNHLTAVVPAHAGTTAIAETPSCVERHNLACHSGARVKRASPESRDSGLDADASPRNDRRH